MSLISRSKNFFCRHKILLRPAVLIAVVTAAVLLYHTLVLITPEIADAKERLKRAISKKKTAAVPPVQKKGSRIITLDEAITMALEKNYLFMSKKAEVAEKEAVSRRMRTGYLPKVNFGSYFRRWNDNSFGAFSDLRSGENRGPYDTIDYNVNVSQNIYDGGKREAVLRKADAELESMKKEYDIYRLNLMRDIKEAYYDALKAARELKLRQGMLEEKNRNLAVTKNLLETGSVLKKDLLKANVELAQAKYNLKKAANDYDLYLLSLKSELGLGLSEEIELKDSPVPRNLRVDLDNLLSKAIEEGPVAKKLKADVRAAKSDIEKAESGFMRPKLSLEGEWGYINKVPRPENIYWKIEGIVSFPIFDGGEALAEIQEAKAVFEQKRAFEKNFINKLEINIRMAYAKIEELKELLPVMEENVLQAKENLGVEKDMYDEGLAMSLEVLKAQNLLASVEADYLAAIYDYNLAVAALECAAGEECDQGYDTLYKNILESEETEAPPPIRLRLPSD